MSDITHGDADEHRVERRDTAHLQRLEDRVEQLAGHVETRLDDHDRRMRELTERIGRLSEVLETLVKHLAGVPEHIASVCQLADAVRTIGRPIGWVLGRGRVIVLAIGATAGSIYGVELLMARWGITWSDVWAWLTG